MSDGLLSTLIKLGASGATADIIYRGHNRAAYDTIQRGFKRFLVQPHYQDNQNLAIDVLPADVPADFEFCSLRRSSGDRSWYELALSLPRALELLRLRRTVLLRPLFRNGGAMHTWLRTADEAIQRLTQ